MDAPTEVSAWSSAVQVSWRPDFAFYEQRIQILRELRGLKVLSRFAVQGEHSITAQLSETRALVVGPGGMTLTESHGSIYQDQTAIDALKVAASLVDPVWGLVQVIGTYIIPISGDYDTVRRSMATAVFGESDMRVTDLALLFDGDGPRGGLRYQVESGVISSAEAPERILRTIGKTSGPTMSATPGLMDRSYPDVGLFADCRWDIQGRGQGADALIDHLISCFNEVRALNNGLASRLYSRAFGEHSWQGAG